MEDLKQLLASSLFNVTHITFVKFPFTFCPRDATANKCKSLKVKGIPLLHKCPYWRISPYILFRRQL